MKRLFCLALLGLLLPLATASAQLTGTVYTPKTQPPSALTTATASVTTASATGGGAAVDATIAVGFAHGLITDCTWAPVSNASVDSAVVALYADAAHTKLLSYITGSSFTGVDATKPLPYIAGTGGAGWTAAMVHDSEDTNAYFQVVNKTGGQDGTVLLTCTFVRDS